MNSIAYWFYTSRLWTFLLRLTGRVPAGYYVGWGHWMNLKDAQRQVGAGWSTLVKNCFDACLATGTSIGQVKEKWGGLRFYVGDAPQWVLDYIYSQELASYKTCEDCGAPGRARPGGWVRTLCDACALAAEKEKQ